MSDDSEDDTDYSSAAEETCATPPLHEAIRNNERYFIEKLFQYKFVQDINATDKNGYTALHVAVLEKNIKVTTILIEHGAKVNLESYEDKLLPEIDALVDRGSYIIDNDDKERYVSLTPLHIAALTGSKNIVKLLIKHGADVNKENYEYIKPIHCAIDSGSVEIVSIIQKNGGGGFSWRICRHSHKFSEKIFCYAGTYGKVDILKHFIKKGIKCGSALLKAARNGFEETVRLLVQSGVDVDYTDNEDDRAIHAASFFGHLNIIRILIDNGAKIDENSSKWQSPLAIASSEGHYEVANILLQNGANVNFVEGEIRRTALQESLENGHLNIAELLMCYGANVDHQDFFDHTLLHSALEYDDRFRRFGSIRALLINGANTEIRNGFGNTPLESAMTFGPEAFKTFLHCKHSLP